MSPENIDHAIDAGLCLAIMVVLTIAAIVAMRQR